MAVTIRGRVEGGLTHDERSRVDVLEVIEQVGIHSFGDFSVDRDGANDVGRCGSRWIGLVKVVDGLLCIA